MTEPIGRSSGAVPGNGGEGENAGAAGPTQGTARAPAGGVTGDALSAGALQLLENRIASLRSAASYPIDKFGSELACATLPCSGALWLAGKAKMADGGLADRMLDHFRSGSSEPVRIDLQAELKRNPQLLEYVTGHIEMAMAERAGAGEAVDGMYGSVWVPQTAYGHTDAGQDQRLALGGTFVEWQVSGSAANGGLEVRVNVSDHYFWTPSERRATQCLHQCGADLVARGKATEFYQHGEARLIVDRPGNDAPITPPALEGDDAL